MLSSPGAITFYITNVCNLNCHDCSYLNNYSIKGHQRWADNRDLCEKWAERLDPALIFILGGEPLANPDFLEWMHGVAGLWPHAEIRINTNGTMFKVWPDLYDHLLPYHGRVNISISNHNEHTKQEQQQWIKEEFLRGDIQIEPGTKQFFRKFIWNKIYNDIKDDSWPTCESLEDYHNLPNHIKQEIQDIHQVHIENYIMSNDPVEDHVIFSDSNHVQISWARWDEFSTSAIQFDPVSQKMKLHDSDPEKAVAICHGGHCAFIKNGKYYKCQVMANLPDLIQQGFPLEISQHDSDLIHAYTPAEHFWDDEKLSDFFSGLQNRDPIPQCKFCPEKKTVQKIHASSKKIKIQLRPE